VLRRRFIEGLRGLSVVGEPVYGGYFQRALHVSEDVQMNTQAPLYEGWEFGHSHPCVAWAQFLPQGALRILGGVMGAALFIEDFAPIALQYRSQWFPHPPDIQSTGDPAGESFSPHGVSTSAVDVLRANGVRVEPAHEANSVDRQDVATKPWPAICGGWWAAQRPPKSILGSSSASVVAKSHPCWWTGSRLGTCGTPRVRAARRTRIRAGH